MSDRILFLKKYAVDGRHYDLKTELHKVIDNHDFDKAGYDLLTLRETVRGSDPEIVHKFADKLVKRGTHAQYLNAKGFIDVPGIADKMWKAGNSHAFGTMQPENYRHIKHLVPKMLQSPNTSVSYTGAMAHTDDKFGIPLRSMNDFHKSEVKKISSELGVSEPHPDHTTMISWEHGANGPVIHGYSTLDPETNHITHMAIRPEHRRKGVGTVLMQHAYTGEEDKPTKMAVHPEDHQTIGFLKKNGFGKLREVSPTEHVYVKHTDKDNKFRPDHSDFLV